MADVDALQKRMKEIETSLQLRLMRSANNDVPLIDQHIQQYLVYTDFKIDQIKEKTNSIFVYTPWMNLDSQGRIRTDFQNQLLFDYNGWDHSMHIAVLETLGAASQLAFFDYQNHGLAQLSLQALIKLAERTEVQTIDASLSSFDGGDDFKRIIYLFEKIGFEVVNQDEAKGVARFEYSLNR
ncbi:hypothetical protein ACFQ4L_06995 [Lapidilactobacillus mulanensis]|uniref:GNAT family N-acetyltransferase n=1 Tax=Lapidilactobacillus mulanensis TaxID=2485999 RepID=A0ABW4DMA7_9LACO|nr:hypothetical protein [Lapidilactobacillus mulanensis]